MTTIVKKSMRINAKRTSIALEPEFWDGVDRYCKARNTTAPKLFALIAGMKSPDQSMASAIRVWIYTYETKGLARG